MARFRRRRRLRRRRLPRRRFRRRRMTYRRRRGRRMTSRSYMFKFKTRGVDIPVTESADPTYGAFNYRLEQIMPNAKAAALIELFDSYKLAAVKTEFRFSRNVNVQVYTGSPTFNANLLPTFSSCIDYNDDTIPSTTETVLNYANCRTTGGIFHKRYFKPRFQSIVYETDVGNGHTAKRGYLSTADPAVPHYCLKYAIYPAYETANRLTVGTYQVYHTYYLKFIATR